MNDASNKRLLVLEKMVAGGQADSFGRYALALEYRKLERHDDAMRTFDALRASDPSYLPMYLIAGDLCIERGDLARAREWLEAGRTLASEKRDGKTLGEIESALARAGS